MQFPGEKNTGCPKAPLGFQPRKDGIPYPLPVGLSWNSRPPTPESVRTGGCAILAIIIFSYSKRMCYRKAYIVKV